MIARWITGCAMLVATALWAQAPPQDWEREIRAFELDDRRDPPPEGAVVFVGSSSIRMWGSLADDFPAVATVNRGFGGSRIADATFHADRIILPHAPRQVVLYAGDNDLMQGRTPSDVAEDFSAFVERLRVDLPGVRVSFISIKPSPSRAHLLPLVRDANARIRRYAQGTPGIYYVDVFTPMLGADGAPRADLFLDDQLHLNRAGYQLWRSVVDPYLSR